MGSMTGAPKIESMNIIDEFESTKRGFTVAQLDTLIQKWTLTLMLS